MPIDTPNIRIVILQKRKEAVVLLKRELYLSDIVSDVRAELMNVNFSGSVIFDMMLIKGVSDHYYHMEFDNMSFDFSTNRILYDPETDVVFESKRYYRTHPELLIQTSLTNRQKECARVWVEE